MLPVSVITPSLNQGRFIQTTIRSVLSQEVTERGVEYVVVDGCSTDNTIDVLRRYRDRLSWVSESDGGQADAVNKGLRMTSGEVIGWLNSDDVFYPGALAAVARFMEEHPDVDVVYGQADHVDAHDAVMAPYDVGAWDYERLLQECYLCQPATFFRRRVVERFGGLDARLQYCMDYEYWIRLAQGGARFALLDQKLAGSRMYPENKTLGDRVRVHSEINDMFRMRLGRVPDRWILNFAHAFAEPRVSRSRSRPVTYALVMSCVSVYASLRWNHHLSREVWRRSLGWLSWAARPAAWRGDRP